MKIYQKYYEVNFSRLIRLISKEVYFSHLFFLGGREKKRKVNKIVVQKVTHYD